MPAPKDPAKRAAWLEANRLAHLGKSPSAETREKLRATQVGRKWSPEQLASVKEAVHKRNRSPENRAKVAKANTGKRHSAETKAKLSKAKKGIAMTPETRAKLEKHWESRRGRKRSPETRARMSQGHRVKNPTPCYRSAHRWLVFDRGKAIEHDCEVCGAPAREWAMSHETEEVITSPKGLRYSVLASDYIAMCFRCHRHYDRGLL